MYHIIGGSEVVKITFVGENEKMKQSVLLPLNNN